MMNILVETKDIAQTQDFGFAVKGVDRVAEVEEETIRHLSIRQTTTGREDDTPS